MIWKNSYTSSSLYPCKNLHQTILALNRVENAIQLEDDIKTNNSDKKILKTEKDIETKISSGYATLIEEIDEIIGNNKNNDNYHDWLKYEIAGK